MSLGERMFFVEDMVDYAEDRTSTFNDDNSPEGSDGEILGRSMQQIPSTEPMETPNVIRTLPDSFNSMINESIEVESDHPRELIKMLGEKLGVNDYPINMTTFWLLDTMALEIVRLRGNLNSKNLALLLGWIAGEAKLIQEKRYSREEFFREMNRIFAMIYKRLGEGRPLIYWEEISGTEATGERKYHEAKKVDESDASSDITSESRFTSSDMENQAEYEPRKTIVSTASDEITRTENGRNSSRNLISNYDQSVPDNPIDVLEAIIESTYRVFANAFHYATVSAAFCHPMKLISCKLPYTLRYPRLIKKAVAPHAVKEVPRKGKGRSDPNSPQEILLPSPTMTDDEIIAENCRYILPLIESNEAPGLIERYSQLQTNNIDTATKIDKKKKRKT